ncbi:MAG: gamma-glutamyl-gamma-aminobutyrate hydrolase family protein [Gemmatimonadota bacterium]|nr:gamma-glutamyl-gamma-aminobutyrate hydrolase family protein [Gemmatimonadota bacterium]
MSSTLMHRISDSRPDDATLRAAHTVAVTATSDTRLGGAHRVRLNSAYVTALEIAGLIPLVIPPLSSPAAARVIIAAVDGLVLTGGEDVDPALYGHAPHEHLGTVNCRRDETEIALVHAAREMRKPVLAICRGPQLLNVALGGTLIQDIASCVPEALPHNSEETRDARAHEVAIEPGSRIAQAVGATQIRVNSLHHQSILEPAAGLRVTARAPDGIIEGVESEDDAWWAIAVQWHPEEMNDSPEPWDRGIFRAFAKRLEEG